MMERSFPKWLSNLAVKAFDNVSDRQLLRRFTDARDEVAFQALVARHGSMVLGVCRRVLGESNDAEDAFQATFLVLAQRANQANRDHLGPWLHGIAHRIALKARTTSLRRLERECRAAKERSLVVEPSEHWQDVQLVLDEEISRLPKDLQTAVVLCDLQGLTRRQAAASIGCPESTLSSRLRDARNRLAKRLRSRGITLSLAGVVAVVPQSLAQCCATMIHQYVLGSSGAIPTTVLTLSQKVGLSMSSTKKVVMCMVFLIAVLTCGTMIAMTEAQPSNRPNDPVGTSEEQSVDRSRVLAFDGFEGQFALNWSVYIPSNSHISLKKNSGSLTIRTQKGTMHGRGAGQLVIKQFLYSGHPNCPNTKTNSRGSTCTTKNLYLIDNPVTKDGDFTVTTCLVDFCPAKQYQQAGLVVFDDHNNYLKWTYEFNDVGLQESLGVPSKDNEKPAMASKGQPYFVLVGERNSIPTYHIATEAHPRLPRVWLRVKKRGIVYDFFTSTDGKQYLEHGSTKWVGSSKRRKPGPKKIGLIAQNGDVDKAELDAQIDFFELRTP